MSRLNEFGVKNFINVDESALAQLVEWTRVRVFMHVHMTLLQAINTARWRALKEEEGIWRAPTHPQLCPDVCITHSYVLYDWIRARTPKLTDKGMTAIYRWTCLIHVCTYSHVWHDSLRASEGADTTTTLQNVNQIGVWHESLLWNICIYIYLCTYRCMH